MNALARRLTMAMVMSKLISLVMGNRFAFCLFVSPLNSSSGVALATLNLALALGQLGISRAQPLIAALVAGRYARRA